MCGLHKITVAVGFLTQILVSQNSSRISRVFRGLLKSTVSKRCSFHLCLQAYSQLFFLGIACPFLYLSALGSIPAQAKGWVHKELRLALLWTCPRSFKVPISSLVTSLCFVTGRVPGTAVHCPGADPEEK